MKAAALPNTRKWSRRERTAYHEAGHTVMHYLLGGKSKQASIIPHKKAGTEGHHIPARHQLTDAMLSKSELTLKFLKAAEKEMLELLAANIAEKMLTARRDNRGAGSDYARVAKLARSVSGGNRRLAWHCNSWLNTKAQYMLNVSWHLVVAIAEALLEKETLMGAEITACILQAKEAEENVDRSLKATFEATDHLLPEQA